jgi:hypothetical protein
MRRGDVCSWHISDLAACPLSGRYGGTADIEQVALSKLDSLGPFYSPIRRRLLRSGLVQYLFRGLLAVAASHYAL